MAGENLGKKDETEANGTETQGVQEQTEAQEQVLNGNSIDDADGEGTDSENGTESEITDRASEAFEKQLAERDEEIAKLKAQVAEAAKSAEKEQELNSLIAELEAKSATERTDYELTLAGCRSTRAGRVLLEDHDGDIAALKEAEPWLFEEKMTVSGVTGLPNAGAATNDDATLAHWRELAGLDD